MTDQPTSYGPGKITTATFSTGKPVTWAYGGPCGLEGCECPDHEWEQEHPKPAGVYITVKLDNDDARVALERVAVVPESAADERDRLAAAVESLAEWHETKAMKARHYRSGMDGQNAVMDKAAEVHEDAARRIRRALDGTDGGSTT